MVHTTAMTITVSVTEIMTANTGLFRSYKAYVRMMSMASNMGQ